MNVIIDCHYLCHRAFHATKGRLTFDGEQTGVIYGVLVELQQLRSRFNTNQLIFCFDSPKSLRENIYPEYKSSRRNRTYTEDEETTITQLRKQIVALRTEILPDLGYINIFQEDGYEGDDLIFQVREFTTKKKQEAVVVTGDSDLYQVINSRTILYNPNTKAIMNLAKFKEKYGIHPDEWALVKAIAGCSSDDIAGISGVGEVTAIKYLTGQLNKTGVTYQKIKAGWDVIESNLSLVELPFAGCPSVVISEQQEIREKIWRSVVDKYGIRLLMKPLTQGELF